MTKELITMVCEDCGKQAEEQSNKNLIVYKTRCKCGGKIIIKPIKC